ncbi:MAG: hypothetical protein K2L28_05080 [Muribaculaceae bacterium]|nr:hypothetical protein [Muribaculaceae bacterium]
MKTYTVVKKSQESVPDEVFAGLEPQSIECCNWRGVYDYAPLVNFRMYHTGECLHVRFDVEEEGTMARITDDNGEVWTDSCVELFLSPDCDDTYYNIETNCIGTQLIGWRRPGEVEHADAATLALVRRESSLPRKTFAPESGTCRWSLTLAIPVEALFRHSIENLSGLTMRANVYKCGDAMPRPHFLSWNPIEHPTPCFHLPAFFGELVFE